MATFQDMQNMSAWRLRQSGVNFGGAAGSGPQNPSYIIKLLLNMGYSEFLSRTIEAQLATLKVSFPTVANATAYALNPIPANGATVNPAALRVLEATYTTATGGVNAGYEYGIELVSTQKFAYYAGDYTRRLSWFGPRVLYAARLYRRPQLDVLPGTANAGDTIALTIVPDPYNSPAGLAAASGGALVNDADVPLFPQQFHMALVDYVVMNAGDAANKADQVRSATERWERYISEALWEGGTEDGGDPMRIGDVWQQPMLREGL